MAIEKLIKQTGRLMQQGDNGKTAYKLMKNVMSGAGKEVCFLEGAALQQLPKDVNVFTQGLKKPKVILGLKSSKEGSGVLGVVIKDGNKPVNKFAVGFDETRGLPIFQMRGRSYVNGEIVESYSSFLNPNVKVDSNKCKYLNFEEGANKIQSLYNESGELAGATHCNGSGMLSENFVDCCSLKLKGFKDLVKSLTDFWKRKGLSTLPLASCEKEFLAIAKAEGQPTIESVTKAKDLLLKRMGYNPKNVEIKVTELGAAAASFEPSSGKLYISNKLLDKATNVETAILLSHEIQHMDDFVKLSKSIGVEKLQKLLGEDMNKKFYEKMAKQAGDIIDSDAETLVKSIEEHCRVDKLEGAYGDVYRQVEYASSYSEYRAREMERKVLDLFRKEGVDIQTKAFGLENYARKSHSSISPILGRLEPKLPVENKEAFFNATYSEAFEKLDPELHALTKKMENGSITREDFDLLNKLQQEKYSNPEDLSKSILLKMEEILDAKKV